MDAAIGGTVGLGIGAVTGGLGAPVTIIETVGLITVGGMLGEKAGDFIYEIDKDYINKFGN